MRPSVLSWMPVCVGACAGGGPSDVDPETQAAAARIDDGIAFVRGEIDRVACDDLTVEADGTFPSLTCTSAAGAVQVHDPDAVPEAPRWVVFDGVPAGTPVAERLEAAGLQRGERVLGRWTMWDGDPVLGAATSEGDAGQRLTLGEVSAPPMLGLDRFADAVVQPLVEVDACGIGTGCSWSQDAMQARYALLEDDLGDVVARRWTVAPLAARVVIDHGLDLTGCAPDPVEGGGGLRCEDGWGRVTRQDLDGPDVVVDAVWPPPDWARQAIDSVARDLDLGPACDWTSLDSTRQQCTTGLDDHSLDWTRTPDGDRNTRIDVVVPPSLGVVRDRIRRDLDRVPCAWAPTREEHDCPALTNDGRPVSVAVIERQDGGLSFQVFLSP